MEHVEITWVENLWAIGQPIRDAAREIARDVEQANADLREAYRKHSEALDRAKRDADDLERSIAHYWTPEEISAAKRGEVLVS